MNLLQIMPGDRGALEALSIRATDAAANALGRMIGAQVQVGRSSLQIAGLSETVAMFDELPSHGSTVYLESIGSMTGHLVLMLPVATTTALMHALEPEPGAFGHDRVAARADVLSEVGNIVLTSYLNEIVRATGLSAEPSTPMVASDHTRSVLELPLARAAGDGDVVVRFDAQLSIVSDSGTLRTPFNIVFLPAPGGLGAVLAALRHEAPQRPAGEVHLPVRVPVRIGELAVSRRAGDVLVASGLGSCVAVGLIDPLARVCALAHVMLPQAPTDPALTGPSRSAYAARYANTAVPALVEALERAGGRPICAHAYLAGGSQMFTGSMAAAIDIPERNVRAVRTALRAAGIRIQADQAGVPGGRTMEIDIETLAVTVLGEGGTSNRLDAAA